jgi:hypothetical protein
MSASACRATTTPLSRCMCTPPCIATSAEW